VEREGLGELPQQGEPTKTMRGLVGEKCDNKEQIDGQGEDLRAEDGFADTLNSGLAAAELSAPPESTGGAEMRCAG
jgi:hypothetical protein